MLNSDFWELNWCVTGPCKRQLITSRFIRAADDCKRLQLGESS